MRQHPPGCGINVTPLVFWGLHVLHPACPGVPAQHTVHGHRSAPLVWFSQQCIEKGESKLRENENPQIWSRRKPLPQKLLLLVIVLISNLSFSHCFQI